MSEFIKQHGHTIVAYITFFILISLIFGGTAFMTKGLLYKSGEISDNKEYKTKTDVEYVTDSEGNTIVVADGDSLSQDVEHVISGYSDFNLHIDNTIDNALKTDKEYAVKFSGMNASSEEGCFFATIRKGNTVYELGDITDENTKTLKSKVKINSVKIKKIDSDNVEKKIIDPDANLLTEEKVLIFENESEYQDYLSFLDSAPDKNTDIADYYNTINSKDVVKYVKSNSDAPDTIQFAYKGIYEINLTAYAQDFRTIHTAIVQVSS